MIEPSYVLDLGNDATAPKKKLVLASVRGILSQGLTRGALAYNRLGDLICPAASIGVVYSRKTHRYYTQEQGSQRCVLTGVHLASGFIIAYTPALSWYTRRKPEKSIGCVGVLVWSFRASTTFFLIPLRQAVTYVLSLSAACIATLVVMHKHSVFAHAWSANVNFRDPPLPYLRVKNSQGYLRGHKKEKKYRLCASET